MGLGYYWKSNHIGNEAETYLLNRLKSDKNKTKIAVRMLNELSGIQNKLVVHLTDIKLLNHLLLINLRDFYGRAKRTKLNSDEINSLRSALHARRMNFSRKYKLPLNPAKDRRNG